MNEYTENFEHDSEDDNPLTRVGEPFVVNCSAVECDWVGVIRIKHKETGEERLLVEIYQAVGSGDDPAEDDAELAEFVADLIVDRDFSAKVMVTPAQARQFAAALLDFADTADGTSPSIFTHDWDKGINELDA